MNQAAARSYPRLIGAMAVALLAGEPSGWAQPVATPTIHRATLRPDTGVLTIAGSGLGPDLHVTVDGQPVTMLAGASESQVEVQAPVSLLTVPGTYRLTVVDPVRRTWDGFVVSSPGIIASVAGVAASDRSDGGAVRSPDLEHAPAFANRPGAAPSPDYPQPLAIIQDTGSPYRTAIGHEALDSNSGFFNTAAGYQALTANTTGSLNTAVGARALAANVSGVSNTGLGYDVLKGNTFGGSNTGVGVSALAGNTVGSDNTAVGSGTLSDNTSGADNTAVGDGALGSNTTGASNTAVGHRAGLSPVAGTFNVFLGADVTGTASDTHTIRIGLPYNAPSQTGQNATFIAGIRGTTVTGGDGVYVDANGRLGSGPVIPAANSVGPAQVQTDALTAAHLAPGAVGSSEIADGAVSATDLAAASVGTPALTDNAVTAAKVAFNYAGSASEGGPATDLSCAGCVAASEVGFAFAGLGANTFSGTQRIGGGNLELGPSTATTGNLLKGGERFLHNPGFMNTFLGQAAGTLTVTGSTNTAVGGDALRSLAGGDANMASGYGALYSNVGGTGNTASGMQALFFTTGSYNTALGMNAGAGNTTGSHNVYVGADVGGASADANTMRLGLPFNATTGAGQNKTFIAGVAGTVLTTPAVQVFVDANGQLGTLVPPPIVGTVNGGVTPGAAPPADAALLRRLDAQDAVIAELKADLARLRAQIAARPARR